MRYVPFLALLILTSATVLWRASAQAGPPDEPSVRSSLAQPAGPPAQLINQYDWNKDGCDDLIARNSFGFLFLFRGTCTTGAATQFQDPVQMTNQSYAAADAILLPGDMDGDTCPDMLSRVSISGGFFDGALYARFGDCATGFRATDAQHIFGFEGYDWFAAPGTWEGSSCPNILARTTATHELHIFESNCSLPGLTITDAGTMTAGWEGFDWMMAPSHWDGDADAMDGYYCGDILTRQSSNASLQWYDGDCNKGFSGAGATQVGTSWGIFDWLLSGGNWSGDVLGNCRDVLGRRSDDGTLRLYAGNCVGGFGASVNVSIGGAIDWRQFNYIVGDSGKVVPTGAVPTVTLAPTPSPTATGTTKPTSTASPSPTQTSAPTPTGNSTPTTAPTPTPSATPDLELVQADNDCDDDVDAVDALKGLQHVAAIPFGQEPGCPNLGGSLPAIAPAGQPPDLFGDVDCDGDADAVDALKILQSVAAIPFTQNEPCTDIGEPF